MTDGTYCDYCGLDLPTDKQVKIWSTIGDKIYHNLCLQGALDKARKYDAIEEIIYGYLLSKRRYVTDVWLCSLCGGYSNGYGVEKCRHCGAKAHYGSDNGHYVRSDKIRRCEAVQPDTVANG